MSGRSLELDDGKMRAAVEMGKTSRTGCKSRGRSHRGGPRSSPTPPSSSPAMVRAIERRAVMKLSGKCRSGRERLRVVSQRPSGRGEITLHAFGDDERVAAEGDGDVVVPAAETPSFEVVEAELALQVLVDALGAPALHDDADELSLGDVFGQGREEVVSGLLLAVAPLDEEPLGVALRVGAGRRDSPEGEAGGKILFCPFFSGAAAEAAPLFDPQRQVPHAHRVASAARLRIEQANDRFGIDTDSVVETEFAQLLPEVARRPVGRVRQDGASRQTIVNRASDHGEPIELEIDGQVLGPRGDAEADADLTVGDLPCRARVLALHADGVTALLEEAGVVDDPGLDGLALVHGIERIARCDPAHFSVAPPRVADEVQKALMGGVHLPRVAANESSHRLDALALGVAEQPHRVDREGGAVLGIPEHLADPGEVALDATDTCAVHEDHGRFTDHAEIRRATSSRTVLPSDRNDRGFRFS